MRTRVVGFPFGLFGAPGTASGAELLLDAVREIRRDVTHEERPTRSLAFGGSLALYEAAFDTLPKVERWRERGRRLARQAWNEGDTLLWLAGNHLGVLPLLEELPADGLVVQFDAHLDLYHLSSTTEELSHGNFLRHWDAPHADLINVGHRDLFLPADEITEQFTAAFDAVSLALDPEPALKRLRRRVVDASQVLIDIDIDVFDPAYCPAVGHAMPFGLAPPLFLRLLDAAWGPNVVGVSISEFDPGFDRDDRTLNLLVWLMEYLLLKWHEPISTGQGDGEIVE